DETSAHCRWHVNEAHPLETWGDVRAFDGTVTIQQPLIAPLYRGRSAIELLASLRGQDVTIGREIVRALWKHRDPSENFESRWRKALRDGVVAETAASSKAVQFVTDWRARAGSSGSPSDSATPKERSLELVFRPDATVWDGRYANSAWLQELPKPLTRMTWEN